MGDGLGLWLGWQQRTTRAIRGDGAEPKERERCVVAAAQRSQALGGGGDQRLALLRTRKCTTAPVNTVGSACPRPLL